MDGAPPIGQRLGVEDGYRLTDEGQGRDGMIFAVHQMFVYIIELNVNTAKILNFTKLRPIRTLVHTAHTCMGSVYRPLSCVSVLTQWLSCC